MLGQGVLENLITSALLGLARKRGALRLHSFAAFRRKEKLRISFSSLLRLRSGEKYLLIRSRHRPEQFGPIGGVNKYYEEAESFLDQVCFQPQVGTEDMKGDLRGFLPPQSLPHLVGWYRRHETCETIEQCLRRELREELDEVGLRSVAVPNSMNFRFIREIWEGPCRLAGVNYHQFRIFNVCDVRRDEATARFLQQLWSEESSSDNLLASTREEIIRGRSDDGRLIGQLTEYILHSHCGRPEGPPIVTPPRS